MVKELSKVCCSAVGSHEICCCGARVRISEEGVKVVTEPTVRTCPLHEAMYGTRQIDVHSVKKSVETKIAHFGFCCKSRHFDADPIVAYGASEMMQVWLRKGLMNCAVVACDGAGTVITSNGELVQGIGARLTGIIRTSPIREVIERIESQGGIVLDKSKARIDQVEGVKKSFDIGFKHISVSVASFQAKDISKIRDFETAAKVDVLIFSVCNTCIGSADVKHIDKADIVCASASRIVRKEIGKKALLQVGVTIPVYALTEKGKRFVLAYLTEFKDRLVVFRTSKLPYQVENKGPRLKQK